MEIQNSAESWDACWDKLPSKFFGSRTFETWYRRLVYFSSFDTLLKTISLSNQDVLELGSGTGNNSLYLALAHGVRSSTLVDFSKQVLARINAKKFPCKLSIVHGDLFGFKPKGYGFVHSTGLIEHFTGEQRKTVVQKHADCAKPGGYVMIWVPVRSFAFSFIGTFNKLFGIEEIPLTETELKTLCQNAGLKIIGENHAVFGALYGILTQKA